MLKRLKIVLQAAVGSDGASKIIDADTGQEIENVRMIHITAGVNEVTVVTLELVGIEIEGDVTGEVASNVTLIK